jgi:hypothetical protein
VVVADEAADLEGRSLPETVAGIDGTVPQAAIVDVRDRVRIRKNRGREVFIINSALKDVAGTDKTFGEEARRVVDPREAFARIAVEVLVGQLRVDLSGDEGIAERVTGAAGALEVTCARLDLPH